MEEERPGGRSASPRMRSGQGRMEMTSGTRSANASPRAQGAQKNFFPPGQGEVDSKGNARGAPGGAATEGKPYDLPTAPQTASERAEHLIALVIYIGWCGFLIWLLFWMMQTFPDMGGLDSPAHGGSDRPIRKAPKMYP